jgi:hypothetical protein
MRDRNSSKGFSRQTLLVLAVCSLVLSGLAWSGCGSSGASQEELQAARQAGAKKAREQQKIQQIQKELKALRKHGGSAQAAAPGSSVSPAPESSGSTSGSGNCGGSLSANEYTTCGFAENVENAYFEEIGSGSGTVSAYSPTKEQWYSMYCTAGSPHECTGGNNAAVYFP